MSYKTTVKALLTAEPKSQEVTLKGWVKAFRSNRFIAINDGSTIQNIQAVVDFEKFDETLLKKVDFGAAISLTGTLEPSLGKGQTCEIQVNTLEILGECNPEEFPLQPKKQTLEFLRENAHLRFRTNLFGAVNRLRHHLIFSIHSFFNKEGFFNIHTPILTASDAEGAGEMFKVTNFDLNKIPRTETGEINYKEDFFGRSTHLTVSGQLEAELAALALGKVYTFGPTFRAENSNTTRHLAEFWMIEPEVAFNDIFDNMQLATDMLKYCIAYVLEHGKEDILFLENRLIEEDKQKPTAERSTMTLTEKLNFVLNNDFVRLPYGEAIEILEQSKPNKKNKFQFPINGWGTDLQSEHERFLVEQHFKKPVILYNYPKEIKAFYMRLNEDNKSVAAMDILFPGIGEIVGGSQREERLDVLKSRMDEMHVSQEELWWYLDTRKFGTVPHAGFGLGFERLLLFVSGMSNIRDVIPFPRTPKNVEF
ncbi:MAG: asparagine--tRNA ligase [Luteibaculaceae bacterium]